MIGQILPNYVVQRKLYEVRERPSKTFSWKVHVLTSILAEIPWNGASSLRGPATTFQRPEDSR